MALYWPQHKVALVVMDDPADVPPKEVDESWTIVPLTNEQVEDYDAYRRVMSRVADLLAASDGRLPESAELPKSA